MDKREYLNQISPQSALPKPVQPSLLDKILKSKFTWIGFGVAVLLVVVLGIWSLVQQNKPNPVQKISEFTFLVESTKGIVDQYQGSLKSSKLRGDSASLGTVLANTHSKMDSYITVTLKSNKVVSASVANSIKQEKAAIVQDLDNAAIEGNLDKVYAIKIAYLISVITTRENEILKTTQSETLREILTSSEESLENLYDDFYEFKGTN